MTTKTLSSLTQDSIIAFVNGIEKDTEKATASHLHVFAEQVALTDIESFKRECKAAAKTAKDTDNQAAQVRISEVRQLFGAIRFCSLVVDGMAYHVAVRTARKTLQTNGLKYDGSRVLSEAEKQQRMDAQLMAKANKALSSEFDWNQPNAAEAYAEALIDKKAELQQEALQQAQAKMQDKVATIGRDIMERYGDTFAANLAVFLHDVLEAKYQSETVVAVAA